MVIITLQRDKCIGCNYCVEMAPAHFQMSKKDGKSVLIHSQNAKGFYTLKAYDHGITESCELAAKACPVHIITVKET
ncbi:ferredoxin [Flavobacterium branchiophilum]|uniref:Ferredoxin n=2 Tax=Flavobacterium branchiophilum TaxID=55197 RepID=G2Z3C6_FLABF|nr:ferredoxin [Flavobacterium branchiophilum]PDS27121.1 ferredoxin [Flavobacterium branchiophilum]CCB68239.1 4Fe-4S ferredoxin, iron-sulfur binding domain protein [Flavobacterium branchiophilum FL-15]